MRKQRRLFTHLKEVFVLVWFGFFAVVGFELRAYTLSHSTSPFCCEEFFSR
jgi:hypothetical protein